jgi:hypothetical protein
MVVSLDIPNAYTIYPFSISAAAPLLSRREANTVPLKPRPGPAHTTQEKPPLPKLQRVPTAPMLHSNVDVHHTHMAHHQSHTNVQTESVEVLPDQGVDELGDDPPTGVTRVRKITTTTRRQSKSFHRSSSVRALGRSNSFHESSSPRQLGGSSSVQQGGRPARLRN